VTPWNCQTYIGHRRGSFASEDFLSFCSNLSIVLRYDLSGSNLQSKSCTIKKGIYLDGSCVFLLGLLNFSLWTAKVLNYFCQSFFNHTVLIVGVKMPTIRKIVLFLYHFWKRHILAYYSFFLSVVL